MKEDILKSLNDFLEPEEMSQMLVNINRMQLNRKSHIKRYNKLRNLHTEIIDSMLNYMFEGKYNIDKMFDNLVKENDNKEQKIEFDLSTDDPDDLSIITELFVYKTHEKIPSLTEIYLEKNKFRNKEKVKFVKAMNQSFASLFKIVATDRENGYVTYEDFFTHKKYKIIDISMSSSYIVNKKEPIYMYNRIITVDDITFATGIHCMLTWENEKLTEFLKHAKYDSKNTSSMCLKLYQISKEEKSLHTTYNSKYGYRR